ncbi:MULTISPECIES: hypothetical protein [unclassified Halomonas]|uniref:hypothetical protein n=1 Tax=unclassified Halomonas TaxID=2609666 RepID=UPI0007DA11B2|nr:MULTISPECIES: hypothetical protein [unclassified Halomonas]MBT2788257.1 hypothetical protein [Halomonas sp. ISL-106]MBT2796006.1 hypothetical protein [Halomonas sp. ISL-104]OAL61276.1 hypothetical protein A6R74_16980 [Halomonas sp. ALS9]
MEHINIFARGVWKCIPDEEDSSWVKTISEAEISKEPLGDFGAIINEMLSKGVASETIARFAKIIGYETAFRLCYHLEDPSASYDSFANDADTIAWGLFEVIPESDAPRQRLTGVHEILLSMDPSGREMRPKNA